MNSDLLVSSRRQTKLLARFTISTSEDIPHTRHRDTLQNDGLALRLCSVLSHHRAHAISIYNLPDCAVSISPIIVIHISKLKLLHLGHSKSVSAALFLRSVLRPILLAFVETKTSSVTLVAAFIVDARNLMSLVSIPHFLT